jgi:hypothetical protein
MSRSILRHDFAKDVFKEARKYCNHKTNYSRHNVATSEYIARKCLVSILPLRHKIAKSIAARCRIAVVPVLQNSLLDLEEALPNQFGNPGFSNFLDIVDVESIDLEDYFLREKKYTRIPWECHHA